MKEEKEEEGKTCWERTRENVRESRRKKRRGSRYKKRQGGRREGDGKY